MHPTIDEQLEGIARLIERTAERYPGDPAFDRLRTATGTLRRIAASWDKMLPFFIWDNDEMSTLLANLEPDLPPTLSTRARALARAKIEPTALRHVHDQNKALRALLAEAVHALPPDASAPRGEIAGHFRERIARDPSSGRARR